MNQSVSNQKLLITNPNGLSLYSLHEISRESGKLKKGLKGKVLCKISF